MAKKAISAIVATVLIILITVASVTIIWAAIIPMIQNNLDVVDADVQFSVVSSGGYTAYDSTTHMLSVQVVRGVDEEEINEIKITIKFEGGDSIFKIVDAPEPNQMVTYEYWLGGEEVPISVSVSPMIVRGAGDKEGAASSYVDFDKGVIEADLGAEVFEDTFIGNSCKNILDNYLSRGDGTYTIDPDGSGSFEVYCDMTTDGGGWTKIEFASDLPHINRWTTGDARRWLDLPFETVLTSEQIQAIQAVSTEGKQRYDGTCDGVLHYYYDGGSTYAYAFGFRFLNEEVIGYGVEDLGVDFTIIEDGCKVNGGVSLHTIWEIRDVRVPIVNVNSRDNGDSNEKFGSELTENPAWLR